MTFSPWLIPLPLSCAFWWTVVLCAGMGVCISFIADNYLLVQTPALHINHSPNTQVFFHAPGMHIHLFTFAVVGGRCFTAVMPWCSSSAQESCLWLTALILHPWTMGFCQISIDHFNLCTLYKRVAFCITEKYKNVLWKLETRRHLS
jgi:hypothetical protein